MHHGRPVGFAAVVAQPSERGRLWLLAALFPAILVLSLWDFYWLGAQLPVVSVTGGALLLIVTVPQRLNAAKVRGVTAMSIAMLAGVAVSTLWGLRAFTIALKAPIGIAFGIVVWWSVLTRTDSLARAVIRVLGVVLTLHVIAWIIQAVVVRTTGTYLDYTGMFSDNSARGETYAYALGFSGEIVRGTGLFAEPSTYSTFVYMCVSARLAHNEFRLRLLDWIALATMLQSISMSGVGFCCVIVVIATLSMRRVSRAVLALGATGLVFAPLAYGIGSAYFVERTRNLGEDGSARHRFESGWEFFLSHDFWTMAFGRGTGAYSFEYGRTAEYLDLLISVGVVGTLVILGGFAWLFLGYFRTGWRALILWAALIPAAPLHTNPFWWVWTACLLARPADVTES